MPTVILAPEQLAPDRLTRILRRSGVLPAGVVTALAVRHSPAINSAIARLEITYSPDVSSAAPKALLLKRNLQGEWEQEGGRDEVAFYADARSHHGDLPMIVPCYDAAYDPDTRNSHLLLLDVSDSHEPLISRDDLLSLDCIPSPQRLEAAVTAVAQFHATWWEHPSLLDGSHEVAGWYGTRGRFASHVERRRREWGIFLQGPGRALPPDLKDLYSYALERLPRLWDRWLAEHFATGKHLTLTHGDCYLTQFLYPRDGQGATYLVDWQTQAADLPSRDLTHLFAAFWTAEQRHEGDREIRLLQRYLDVLARAGVVGYGWEQLQLDYRLLLVFMALYPVWDAVNGSSKEYWWPKMQCLASAYRDWACEELLA